MEFKDKTFAKIVERTSKRDAYQKVLSWAKHAKTLQDVIYYLNQMVDGHSSYLKDLQVEYNYETQSLDVKIKGMN